MGKGGKEKAAPKRASKLAPEPPAPRKSPGGTDPEPEEDEEEEEEGADGGKTGDGEDQADDLFAQLAKTDRPGGMARQDTDPEEEE